MSEDERALLLSLRPRFAEAILDGNKTVEVRRRPLNASPGSLVFLYASAPTMAVVGAATLVEVRRGGHGELWRKYGQEMGLDQGEYETYLDGTHLAYALKLSTPSRFSEGISLERLRAEVEFRPPQSFRYLARREYKMFGGFPLPRSDGASVFAT